MIIVNISPEYKYSKESYKSPRDLNTILGFVQGVEKDEHGREDES